MTKGAALVIDDDPELIDLVALTLSRAGYRVATAASGEAGVALAGAGRYDLAVLDLRMPGMGGMAALKELKRLAPGLEVIILTAHGSVETAVESMRLGAFDYLKKPFSIAELEAVADKALEKRRLGDLARAALACTEPAALMRTIMDSALALLGADEAAVILDGGEAGPRVAAAAGGAGPGLSKPRFDFCLLGLLLLEEGGGEPLALSPSAYLADFSGAAELAAAIFLPLPDGGMLAVSRRAGGAPFGEAEIRRAKAMGPVIALAMKNAALNGRLGEVRVQLAQTQKMESLGLLAGQISHDFNNLLSVIIGSVQLLMEDLRPGSALKLSEDILRMARDSETLIKQLLLFARRDLGPPVPQDLNRVIDETKLILGKLSGKGKTVEYTQDRGLPKVIIRPEHLKQVVMNLTVNARNYTAVNGRIYISTRLAGAGEELPPGVAAAPCIVLEVADDGPGISPADLKRVFDPFFTTRPEGKGTGMGLHIAKSVLKEYGGGILAGNRAQGGAVFKVFLPAAQA